MPPSQQAADGAPPFPLVPPKSSPLSVSMSAGGVETDKGHEKGGIREEGDEGSKCPMFVAMTAADPCPCPVVFRTDSASSAEPAFVSESGSDTDTDCPLRSWGSGRW